MIAKTMKPTNYGTPTSPQHITLVDTHFRLGRFFQRYLPAGGELHYLRDIEQLTPLDLGLSDLMVVDLEDIVTEIPFGDLACTIRAADRCRSSIAICGTADEERLLDRMGFGLVIRTPFSEDALRGYIDAYLGK